MEKKDLLDCHKMIEPYIHRTPVLRSATFDSMTGAQIYFKCENFQKMGAFKMRGAMHSVLSLNKEQLKRGVVTHSSGNFAQAVSLAAKSAGIKAFIVMPSNAPSVKVNAVKGYGGEVIICSPSIKDREDTADQVAEETGATLLHPSNDIEVILGQGTAALELLQDVPELDAILAPVGGGGLLAGTALAAYFFGNHCESYGVEPQVVDDAFRSMKSGKIEFNDTTDTVADGLRTNLGDVNFPIIKEKVKEIILVSESEIIEAMKLIWERMKIIVEASAAVPFAGLLKNKERFVGKKVGIILSGGNVDFSSVPF